MSDQSVSEVSEFEAAFEEIAKGKTVQATPVDPVKPEAKPEPVAKPEPAPAAPEAKAEPTIEELQAQVRDALHRERSSANRISSFTRANEDLKARIAEMESKLAQAKPPAPAAAPEEADMLDEAPDLRAAIERRVSSAVTPLRDELTQTKVELEAAKRAAAELRQVAEPLGRKAQQDTFEATWKALDEQFTPQWREDLRSEKFSGWLAEQPVQIKDLYDKAVSARDSAVVVRQFYLDNGGIPTKQPEPTSGPASKPNQERLRQASGISSRNSMARPSGPAEDDFEGNFAEAWKRLRKQA